MNNLKNFYFMILENYFILYTLILMEFLAHKSRSL